MHAHTGELAASEHRIRIPSIYYNLDCLLRNRGRTWAYVAAHTRHTDDSHAGHGGEGTRLNALPFVNYSSGIPRKYAWIIYRVGTKARLYRDEWLIRAALFFHEFIPVRFAFSRMNARIERRSRDCTVIELTSSRLPFMLLVFLAQLLIHLKCVTQKKCVLATTFLFRFEERELFEAASKMFPVK